MLLMHLRPASAHLLLEINLQQHAHFWSQAQSAMGRYLPRMLDLFHVYLIRKDDFSAWTLYMALHHFCHLTKQYFQVQ